MKKVLLLLITLIALLSVPQTAEAWGWMKIRGNFDGWSEAGATLTVDPNDDSHYTGTLTVAPDKIATLKSDGLWFRLVEEYTNNVGPTTNGTVYTLGSAAEGKENGNTENCWTMTYDGTIKYNVDVRWKEDGGNRRFETTLTAVADDSALRTIYFLTPFTDRNVKLWAWGNYSEEEIFNITGVDWDHRPAMTNTGETEERGGITYNKYSYTFAKIPSYISITDGEELKVYDGAAFEYGKTYVYEKTTKTIKIINDAPWDDVAIYTWNWGGTGDSEGRKFGAWPGTKISSYDKSKDFITVSEATADGTTTYTVSISDYLRYYGSNLIINNNDNGLQKTKNLKDGITYNTAADQTFTVYFKKPDGWTKVYAYTFGDETEGGWPGTEATPVGNGFYKWTYTGYLPEAIIFNNGSGGDGNQSSSITVRGSSNNGKAFILDGTETTMGTPDASEMDDKLTGDGHDVIYQLNFGSFTSEGTIAAATAQLDYLKGKGVDVIWVMPIHPRGTTNKVGTKGSPYAATDYSKINPDFGTSGETDEQRITDFKNFISTAHGKGMKVWLDWAVNHTSVDHVWVSSHSEYYAKENNQFVHPVGGGITYNDVYQLDLRFDGEDDNGNPIKSDVGTPSDAQDAMIAEMKKWVDGTNAAVDGFRCDMPGGYGGYLPVKFWTYAIEELRKVKADLKFLAETDLTHHNVDLTESGWDLDYAWNFHSQLKDVTNISSNPDATAVKEVADRGAFDDSHHMFYVTNHDVADGKSLNQLFGDNAYALTVMEFTLPGTPLLYHGQENGYLMYNTVAFSDDQKVDLTSHNYKMENTVKALINLKHSNPALADGNAKGVYVPLDTYSNITAKTKSTQVVSYARRFGAYWVLVVLNLSDQAASATIDGLLPGTWKKVLDSENIAYGIDDPVDQPIEQATSLYLKDIEPHGYRIYTLTADTDYKAGYYMLYDGHWTIASSTAQAAAPQLTKNAAGSAVQDGVYTFVIDDSNFDTYGVDTNEDGTKDRVYFKLKEFYEYYGTVIPNVADIVRPFKQNTETQAWDIPDPEFTSRGEEKSPLWNLPTSGTDEAFYFDKKEGVKRYIVTLKRIREPQYDEQGQWKEDKFNTTVQVQFVTSLDNTFKLHHYNDDGTAMVNTPMKTYTDGEDFTELLGADEDYQYAIGITADKFDNYTLTDNYGRLFFAFQESDGSGLKGYVAPDGVTQGRPLTETSNVDNETKYLEWDQVPSDKTNFWKDAYYIKKQAGVKQYIIKLRKNNNNTYTVKVEFRKTEPFKGSSVDDILGERVYLYNVGAKKFIIATGAWGTEAGLLFNDLGMQYIIKKTEGSEAYTVENTVKTNWGTQLGVDTGHDQIRFYVDRSNGDQWKFIEVPGKPNTYEMVLNCAAKGGDISAYAGNTVISNDGKLDGMSQDVDITERNDEVCFTTNKASVTGGDPEKEKYFQWKIVKYQELLNRYRGVADSGDNYGKANEVDATFMLNDFSFARGNLEAWTQTPTGIFNKNRMRDYNLTGKYYHALIQKSGTLSQKVRCYVGGVYRFRCNGFSQSNGKVQMFIQVPGQTERTQAVMKGTESWQTDGYSTARLGNNEYEGLYNNINNAADDIKAGIAFWNNEFVNDCYFYVPSNLIGTKEEPAAGTTIDDDGYPYIEVEFGFKIANGFSYKNDYTALDNVRIHYIGRSPFVLNEKAANAGAYTYNETDLATYTNDGKDTNYPIYLERNFWENQWNPLILPFDVEEDDLLAAFGANTQLADQYGLDDNNPYLIKFTSIPTSEGIVAGHFYMVKPSKLDYKSSVQLLDGEGNVTVKNKTEDSKGFLSMGMHPLFGQIKKNLEAESTTTKLQSQIFAPGDLFKEHNSIRLTGSYFPQTTKNRAYVFGYNKTEEKVRLYHMVNSQQVSLNGFRFYINDVDASGTEYDSDALGGEGLARLFSGFELRWDDDEATGITANTIRSEQTAKGSSHVYNLQGQMVAKDASLLNTLPAGVYIVNGKKIIVK